MTLPGDDKMKAKAVLRPTGHAGGPRVAAGRLGSPWFAVPGQQPGRGLCTPVSMRVFTVHFEE